MQNSEKQADLLRRMEEDGYILEVAPHNQWTENHDNIELIQKGFMKKITYTASIFDAEIEDLIDARSCDTFTEALNWAIDWYVAEVAKGNKK